MNLTLFLLLGYPGAGKSTVSRGLAERFGLTRINSDDLRRYMYDNVEAIRNTHNNPAVFGALDYVAEKLLAAGQSVIYDANNNRRKDRIDAGKLAAKYDARPVIIWIRTPLDVAKARNDGRTPDEGYGRIPEARYTQLVANLQEPMADETVIELDGLSAPGEQVQAFEDAARIIGIL